MNLELPRTLRKRSSTNMTDELNGTKRSKTTASGSFSVEATSSNLDCEKKTGVKTTEEPTCSKIRDWEIDKISIDSQEDDPEFMEEITREMERLRTERTGRTKGPKLAAQDIMSAIPIWNDCLSTISAQPLHGGFDKISSEAFSKLHESIRMAIYTALYHADLKEQLTTLCEMCEIASSLYLRQQQFDQKGFVAQIKKVSEIAKFHISDGKSLPGL